MLGSDDRRVVKKREREIPEVAAAVRRMVRALGQRVGDADPIDLLELERVRQQAEVALAEAVKAQRRAGFSWQAIADGLGVTRQSAWQRFGP